MSEKEGQGGREQEFMFLNQMTPDLKTWHTMVKGAKKVKPGNKYSFFDGTVGTIIENEGDEGSEFRTVKFEIPLDDSWFEKTDIFRFLRIFAAKTMIQILNVTRQFMPKKPEALLVRPPDCILPRKCLKSLMQKKSNDVL